MKCKICGRECPPGSKICRDCASARKRAFAVTVTEPLLAAAGMPSVAEPRFAPKPVRPRLAAVPSNVSSTTPRPEAPAALPLHVVPRTLGVHWMLIGIAMAATIVVLLVKVLGASGSNGHASDEINASASSAAQPPAVTTPATSPQADAGVAQVNPASAKTPSDLPPAKSAPGKAPQRKALPRPDAASVVVAAPAPPEPAAIARPPAPPPRAIEAPRSDPWQAMNEGLSRCAREDLFSRAACEQRLRLQYCGNYWGLVPQCPIGPSTDHGQ